MNKFQRCSIDNCVFKTNSPTLPFNVGVVTKETREGDGIWVECAYCNLVINQTGVKKEDQTEYYNNTYQIKNSFVDNIKIHPKEHFTLREDKIISRSKYLSKYLTKKSVIFELGCGSGELLFLLKPFVKKCFSNEINREFKGFIKDELDIECSAENYLDTPPGKMGYGNFYWDNRSHI